MELTFWVLYVLPWSIDCLPGPLRASFTRVCDADQRQKRIAGHLIQLNDIWYSTAVNKEIGVEHSPFSCIFAEFQKSTWNQHYKATIKWPHHSITVDQVDALFNVLPLTWSCWKRLYELRENLYEPVKDSVRWETWATALLMSSSMNLIFLTCVLSCFGTSFSGVLRCQLW